MEGSESLVQPLRFQHWELLPLERVLLVRGEPVQVGGRAFDVLLALARRPGQVLRRSELLDAVWRNLVVEDNNLNVQIGALRKLLGQRTIGTVPGLGYRLTALPLDAGAAQAPAAPAAPPPREAGNLPAVPPTLYGRGFDIAALSSLVSAYRLVSVTGAGGIGKTRLAQAVAHQQRAAHAAGVWMVELASLTDPELLPAAVAQALGARLPGQKTAQEELVEVIGDAPLLLVLDNCEHLVQAASMLARALLEGTRGARILVTSQELLKLPGEHVYRLAPLSVPQEDGLAAVADHGAVQLLATRVHELDSRFEINERNAADAAEICRRLDGLPLAIELAAARFPLLGLAGIRERLDERFHVLNGGSRAGLRRHRTLRETLAWSHGLLTADERAVFRRAGVFAGGFGMRQAQQVLQDAVIDEWAVLDLLGELVDKSLVVVDAADPPRYRLLESARAYALEMLQDAGETQATLQRHAQAMLGLFEHAAGLHWQLPSQDRLQLALPELDNGRAALDWALHGDPPLYVGLAGALAWVFAGSGQSAEGLLHCMRALERVDAGTPAFIEARLQHALCGLAHDASDTRKLVAAQRAVALYRGIGDSAALYVALGRLAITAALCNDSPCGLRATEEMAALSNPAWPRLAQWDLLNARDYVLNLLLRQETGPARERLLQDCKALARAQLALATEAGDSFKTLFALMAMEQCAATEKDYAGAVQRGRELLEIARRERYVEKLHIYVANFATALVMAGQLDEALPVARQAAAMDARHGSLWQSLDMLAMLACRRGRLADAALVLGRADAANAWRGGDFREPVEGDVREALLLDLQAALPAAELAHLRQRGAALSDDEAARIALAD